LKFQGNGQTLKWRRDLLDGWTFHVDVPAGVSQVEASLDFMAPSGSAGGEYTAGASTTSKMAIVSWNTLVLYPAGFTSDQLSYQAQIHFPEGWKFSTSLPIASQSGGMLEFKPVSLTMLVDSP